MAIFYYFESMGYKINPKDGPSRTGNYQKPAPELMEIFGKLEMPLRIE